MQFIDEQHGAGIFCFQTVTGFIQRGPNIFHSRGSGVEPREVRAGVPGDDFGQ